METERDAFDRFAVTLRKVVVPGTGVSLGAWHRGVPFDRFAVTLRNFLLSLLNRPRTQLLFRVR